MISVQAECAGEAPTLYQEVIAMTYCVPIASLSHLEAGKRFGFVVERLDQSKEACDFKHLADSWGHVQ